MVLDEADEMLSRGFMEQVYEIYRHLPGNLQSVVVSATLPNEILSLTDNFLVNPVKILVRRDELSLEGIK